MARPVLAAAALCMISIAPGPCAGHVRMFYNPANPGISIRNARAATQDGSFSVAGPCGGTSNWGANGVFEGTPGLALALTINYNGGHRSASNAFRAVWTCSMGAGPSEESVKAIVDDAGQTLQLDPQNTVPVANGDGTTVPAPNGNAVAEGYTLAFAMPAAAQGRCTVSVLDQRDWGGCVDLELRAPAPPPAQPPPPPETAPPPLETANAGVAVVTEPTTTTTTTTLPPGMAVSKAPVEKGAAVINITMKEVGQAQYRIGDTIIIAEGTRKQETNVIEAFGSLILKFPLAFDHPAGFQISLSEEPDERIVPKLISASYHANASTCQVNLDGCCCISGSFDVNVGRKTLGMKIEAVGCKHHMGTTPSRELVAIENERAEKFEKLDGETQWEEAANRTADEKVAEVVQTLQATATLHEVEDDLLKLETDDISIGGQVYHVVLQIGPDILPEVTFANIDDDAPKYCDGYAEIDESSIRTAKSKSGDKKGGGGGAAAAVIIILLLLAAGIGYTYKTSPEKFDVVCQKMSGSGNGKTAKKGAGGGGASGGARSPYSVQSEGSSSALVRGASSPSRPPPPRSSGARSGPVYAVPTPRAQAGPALGYGNSYEAPPHSSGPGQPTYAEPDAAAQLEAPRYGAPTYDSSGNLTEAAKKPVVAKKPFGAKLPPAASSSSSRAPHGPPPPSSRAPPPRAAPPSRTRPPPARRSSQSDV